MNEKDRREILKNMTPEQLAKANELYDQIKRFAEPEIDYENMTMDKVDEYLLHHGYDPEQVGLRGKILADALIENVDLRAEVARLTAALAAANEDAERLSSEYSYSEDSYYEEDTGWRCIHCGASHKHSGWKMVHEDNCPITLHRARVGGAS